MLSSIFWVCFGVGAGFVVLSFVLGELFGLFGGSSGSASNCSSTGSSSSSITECPSTGGGNSSVSPFMPKIIALFLTIFGGAGLLLESTALLWVVVVPIALLAGLLVSFLVFRFVVVPLHRSQNTSVKPTASFVGSTAEVVLRINQGAYGEIMYSARGNTLYAPAKSETGETIEKGVKVKIVYIEDGTFYVSKSLSSF